MRHWSGSGQIFVHRAFFGEPEEPEYGPEENPYAGTDLADVWLACPHCGHEFRVQFGFSETLVGGWDRFTDEAGDHDHDDNCASFLEDCPSCDMEIRGQVRRRCAVPGCAWVGKDFCRVHNRKTTERVR